LLPTIADVRLYGRRVGTAIEALRGDVNASLAPSQRWKEAFRAWYRTWLPIKADVERTAWMPHFVPLYSTRAVWTRIGTYQDDLATWRAQFVAYASGSHRPAATGPGAPPPAPSPPGVFSDAASLAGSLLKLAPWAVATWIAYRLLHKE
jgi:hypothetical protein